MVNQIRLISEKDGVIERNFKHKLTEYFAKNGADIRAYLVQIDYGNPSEVGVLLGLKMNGTHTDEGLFQEARRIFKSLFEEHQQLDTLFLNDEQELKVRQICCPFYVSYGFQILQPDFYLTSGDGYRLDDVVRKCFKKERLYGHSDGFLLCDMEPVLIGQSYGLGDKDIDLIVLSAKHFGFSLFPISTWPCFVHVSRPLVKYIENRTSITKSDIELIAWAELYRTEAEAAVNLRPRR